MNLDSTYKYLINATVFAVLGIILLALSFVVFDRLTPGKLWHEIVDKQNTALALTAAAMILGMAFIIGMAIHG